MTSKGCSGGNVTRKSKNKNHFRVKSIRKDEKALDEVILPYIYCTCEQNSFSSVPHGIIYTSQIMMVLWLPFRYKNIWLITASQVTNRVIKHILPYNFVFLLLPELEEERPWLSKRTKEDSCYWLGIGFPSCLYSKCVYVSIFGNIRCKLTIKIYFVWKSKHKTFRLHCCL